MAAARYWRIIGIETHAGGDLELSELALFEGAARVDTAATLTTTAVPVSGALSDLQDESFATSARWPGGIVSRPGFALVWDFGAGVTKDISELRFAGPDSGRFVLGFTIEQSSDGAAWSKRGTYYGVPHAGAAAFTPLVMVSEVNIDAFDLIINAEGSTLEEATANRSRESVTFSPDDATLQPSGASVDTTRSKFGTRSILFNGSSDYLAMKAGVLLRGVGSTGDFCIAVYVRVANTSGTRCVWTFDELQPMRLQISNGVLELDRQSGAGGTLSSSVLTWGSETFYQIAVERYNGNISVYRDGVRVLGPSPDSSAFGNATRFHLGRNPNPLGLWFFSGNMDAITVSRFAQFKGEFTPPTAAPGEWPSNLLPYRNVLRTPVSRSPSLSEEIEGFTQAIALSQFPQFDVYDAGRGRVVGTVKEKGSPSNIPLKRRVVLLSMPGSRAIRETWSDPASGVYEFREIAMDRRYTVISYDHTGVYRGVVADNLSPELMT